MIVLNGKHFLCKKTFQVVFHFLCWNFSSFPTTVIWTLIFGSRGTFHEKKVFEIHVFFHFRKLGQTSAEIWCKNSEKVVRTALYVPGETYQERNFLWKKILIHFWRPGWSFPGLLRKFFDMIFKSELQVPKRNFFEKLSYGRKFKHLHSQT